MTRFVTALVVLALLASDAWACGLLSRSRERQTPASAAGVRVIRPSPVVVPVTHATHATPAISPAPVPVVRYLPPAASGGCPGGVCPLPRK